MVKKLSLLFSILMLSILFLISIVNADTNGAWYFPRDIKGGSFGSDEQPIPNYTFNSNVYFNKNMNVGRVNLIGNSTYFLNIRGISKLYKVNTSTYLINNNFGIGTNNPQAKLDVRGGVKVGYTTVCNLGSEGTMRYNSSEKIFELCDGSVWNPIIGSPKGKLNCKAWYDSDKINDGVYLIDPDGDGPIEAEELYCYMSAGQWALVMGVQLNDNHVNSGEVAGDLTNFANPSGKVSDAFINALSNSGRKELALESYPVQFDHCGVNLASGFSCAWLFPNCNFASTGGMYCYYVNNVISGYGGMGNSIGPGTWGGYLGSSSVHEEYSEMYFERKGRLWVR